MGCTRPARGSPPDACFTPSRGLRASDLRIRVQLLWCAVYSQGRGDPQRVYFVVRNFAFEFSAKFATAVLGCTAKQTQCEIYRRRKYLLPTPPPRPLPEAATLILRAQGISVPDPPPPPNTPSSRPPKAMLRRNRGFFAYSE